MRAFAQESKTTQQTKSAKAAIPGRVRVGQGCEVNSVTCLQRMMGNQAAHRLLQAKSDGLETVSDAIVTGRFDHDFSLIRIPGGASAKIQSKPAVSTPGDVYEEKAERVSEQVMRMPEPQLSRACACGGGCPKCQMERTGQDQERLRTKRVGPSDLGRAAVPPIANDVLRSAGRPLDPPARAFMEARFGHDFSQVRVYADARAGDSARALQARAYTVGRNVVFAPEQYAPHTAEGRRLLAHELAHVVQQSSPDHSGKVVMRQAKPAETKFSGCTGTQPNQIETALNAARKALNRAAAVVGSAYGKPSSLSAKSKQLLLAHFHTTSHNDLRRILGTYISVERAVAAGLEFQCETKCPKTATGVVCGYAYNTQWFGGRGPIHICFDTSGCDFATTAANNQVALVIHEAAHRHAGIDDKVYAWDPKYASLSAKDAMDNADSYAWFAVLV
jgi:hypothetical protein